MHCPTCGSESPPGSAFCGQCGTRFAAAPPPSPTLISAADFARLQRYLTPARLEPLPPPPAWRDSDLATTREQLFHLLGGVMPYLPRNLIRNELTHLRQPQPLAGGEFLDGALLFSDVSGFTALSERLSTLGREGAEQVTDIINRYFGAMLSIIFAHGGDVFKFGGDALLVFFPDLGDPGSLAALQAAWRMQEAMAEFAEVETSLGSFPLRMKIGLNAGSVFTARLGTASDRQFVVTGQVVNATAHAESLSTAGQILCNPAVYRQTAAYLAPDCFMPGPEEHVLLTKYPTARYDPHPSGPFPIVTKLPDLLTTLDRLTPYLPAGLLPRLIGAPLEYKGGGEHRLIGVLFANFHDASAVIARLGSAQPLERAGAAGIIAAQLNQYFMPMQAAIMRYEGIVNKIDLYDHGDKIMALFGAPIAHEDDAERTVRAALDMQAAEKDAGPMFVSQSIGVNTGVVFAGHVGSNARREYTVMGDTVNLAARLMSAAPQGELLLSEAMQRKVSPFFELANRGAVKVKGKAQPVPIFSVSARRAQPEPVRGIRGLHSPLVGRAREEQLMRDIALALRGGRGSILSIIGEAGLGKSRLVNELRAGARGQDSPPNFTWLEGHCLSYTQNVSYSAFIEIMRGALGIFVTDSDSERWTKLHHRLDELLPGEAGADVLPYLAHFLNLPLEGVLAERVAYLEGEALQRQVIRSVVTLLEKMAQHQPLVLMFDDLHWADSASLTLLERLLAIPDRAPLLVGLLYRPDRSHGCWALGQTAAHSYPHRYAEIGLKPLNVAAGEDQQLVKNLLSIETVPETLAQLIGRAEGNPFYIEEMIRTLIDAQAIVQRAGHWHIAPDLSLEAVPDSLQGIIMARIDRLLEEARRALQLASVVGRTFRYVALNWLSTATSLAHLDSDLADLQRAELVREQTRLPDLEYGFAQAMFRDVAYESLLVRDRRTYHRLVGQQLEELYPGSQRDDVLELLAHHYSLSDDQTKALIYLIKAGDKTRAAYANKEAITFYRQADALAQHIGHDEDKATIAAGLGDVSYHIGEYDEALKQYDRALPYRRTAPQLADLQHRIGAVYEKRGEYTQALASVESGVARLMPDYTQTVEMARLLTLQCRIYNKQSKFEEGIHFGQQALTIIEDTSHYQEIAQAHNELGNIFVNFSQPDKAVDHLERGLLILERIGDEHGASKICNNLAFLYYQTDLERSAEYLSRALQTMQRLGNVPAESTILQNLGIIQYARSNYAQAVEYYQRSLAMKERLGDSLGIADCHINLGEAYRSQDDFGKAIYHLQKSLAVAQEIGSDQTVAECYCQLAECYLQSNQLGEALIAGSAALDYAQKIGDRGREAIVHKTLGKILYQQHETAAAFAHLENSLLSLRELNSELDLAWACHDYALMLIEAGDRTQGREKLLEAAALFRRLNLPQEHSKTQDLLDKLG